MGLLQDLWTEAGWSPTASLNDIVCSVCLLQCYLRSNKLCYCVSVCICLSLLAPWHTWSLAGRDL